MYHRQNFYFTKKKSSNWVFLRDDSFEDCQVCEYSWLSTEYWPIICCRYRSWASNIGFLKSQLSEDLITPMKNLTKGILISSANNVTGVNGLINLMIFQQLKGRKYLLKWIIGKIGKNCPKDSKKLIVLLLLDSSIWVEFLRKSKQVYRQPAYIPPFGLVTYVDYKTTSLCVLIIKQKRSTGLQCWLEEL